jgi:hypothetical protein
MCAAEEARDFFERVLCGGEADPLRRLLAMAREPFERQREVRAAFGRHERVDLVNDHRLDTAQRFARVRGQHQIQRFRRRDEDVGRFAQELRPLAARRVACADGDARQHERFVA